jgi:hypothetical protein
MTPIRFAISALVLLAGLAALFLVALEIESPLRAPITIGFSLVGPGWAIIQRLRLQDPVQELMLTIAVSFAVVGLVAGASVYLERWSPGLVLAALVVVTGIAFIPNPFRLGAPSSDSPEPEPPQEARA